MEATTDDNLSYSCKFWNEIKDQFKTSWPTLCTLIMYRLPWLISLRFVGAMGAEQLAAAALATTLSNVTGLSLSVGLSSALTTLTGQARGNLLDRQSRKMQHPKDCETTPHDNQPLLLEANVPTQSSYEACEASVADIEGVGKGEILLPMVFLYRGLFVQLLFVIPVGLWWISGIHDTLVALGQSEIIAEMTAVYLRILAPGLWAYSINYTITTWLQTIEMADVPAYVAFVALLLHVPLNYFFIYGMGWGYLGAATATAVSQMIQPIGAIIYLFGTSTGKSRLHNHTMATVVGRKCVLSNLGPEIKMAIVSYDGMKKYLSLAIPGIISISEWWASEVTTFLAGRLMPHPEVALGGMTLYQSINSFCFMFPVASAVAGSARIGKFLGANDPERADIAAKVSVTSAAMLSGIIGCVLYSIPHGYLPSLFTLDEAVIQETSRTIPLLSTYVFADGLTVAFNGIIKGCGRQCIVMPIVVAAYWMVGVPSAYHFAFNRCGGIMSQDLLCGDEGLVAGLTLGTWTHMTLLATVVIATTNWQSEAYKAKQRLTHADEAKVDLP